MDRAEGVSSWRIGDREICAEDELTVDDDAAIWAMAATGSGRVARVAASDPGARRFIQNVLREKARIAYSELIRPAPKPPKSTRRARRVDLMECPACGGTGPVSCATCQGDGWVRVHD